MRMLAILKHNLGNLTRFSGRTGPKTFWLYVAAVMLFYMGGIMLMIVPPMVSTMIAIQSAASEHGGDPWAGGPVEPGIPPNFMLFAIVNAVLIVAVILLLAAAVSRRLHDTNRRGWWGLMPVPFLLGGAIGMSLLFGSFGNGREPDMRLFLLMFVNNLIYLVMLAILVVLLAWKGTPGPNRFGERLA
jgi:uncharacterized membrane protein YhaH (DUF805 family)